MWMTTSERAAALLKPRPPKPTEVCPTCRQILASPRNRERHNLLFAILDPAFNMWPHQHEFCPLNTEDLRYFLLCEAGWCDKDYIEFAGKNPRQIVYAITAFMNKHRDRKGVQYRATDKGIKALLPKSIAWNKCREHQFKPVLTAIVEYLEITLGVTVEQLKREHKNVA